MDNLSNKIIAYLGRTPDFETEVKLVDDGDGKPYIAEWNAKDKAKPTDDELNALDTDATKLENNAKADANRKTEYGSWEKQLDYIYHNGISNWKSNYIKPIKDKYPKE